MTPAQRRRVQELFDAAAALPDEQRAAYIEREAANDAEVLAAVKALLVHDGGSASFAALERLDPGAVAAALGPAADDEPWRRSLASGKEVDGYRIVRVIAEGGMGVVCEAVDLGFPGHRRVALKVLKPEIADATKRRERFLREASAAGRLEHPSIARVYATGSAGTLHYLAMELIDGPSLADVLRWRREGCPGHRDRHGRPIPDADGWRTRATEKACRAVCAVANALESTHEHGILHRDVKPSNVLLRPETGEPVLTDFGLARTDGDQSLTRSGDFLGTPYYVAPEQARGADVDGRADVYSLGATLFELLALRVPFPESSTAEVLAKLVSKEEAPALRTLTREVPHDLDRVVARALEKDADQRYANAAAFAHDLERFLAYRPVEARPLGPLTRLARWARQHKAITTSVVLVFLLLATGTGAAFVFRDANARSAFATARASAKRGAWPEALERYEEARRYGHDDDVAVTIGEIEAWQGLARNERALAELGRLEQLHDLGPHRAKVLLLRGLMGHNRFVDPDAGVDRIEAALDVEDHPLSPADAAFALAYLATDLVDTKVHLEEALRLDPAHHGAITNLAFVEILLGGTEGIDSLLWTYRTLAPENPNAIGTIVILHATSGDLAAARSLLETEAHRLPPHLRSALDAAVEVVSRAHAMIESYEPVRGREDALANLDLFRLGVGQLLPSFLQLWALLRGQGREEFGFEVALPPAAARLVGDLVQFAVRFPIDEPAELVARLSGVLDREPLSMLFQLRANLQYASGRFRDAERDYDLALRTPGPLPDALRAMCAMGEFSSQFHLAQAAVAADRHVPAALHDRMIRTLGRLTDVGGLSGTSWEYVHSCAAQVARPADVLAVAMAWRREHPGDPDALGAILQAVAVLESE